MREQRFIAYLGLVICCVMLLLAVPRFIASLYALYPQAALKQMQENLPEDVYENSIADLTRALNWYEDADYWQTQAAFYLKLFNMGGDQKRLKQAQDAIIRGLKLLPVDPYAWLRLAMADSALGETNEKVLADLRLSFYAGRVEPDLLLARFAFVYDYFGDQEIRKIWQQQIPIVWRFQGEQLIQFVVRHPEAKVLVEQAFIHSPDEWQKFSFDLEKNTQKNL